MGEPVLFGNYELLDRIAEGGMAEVWRARSRGVAGFEKTVVIKRVLPALMAKPGFAELLVREAKIAARLSHPRIVQIFDLGEENGSYFIAMEYVHGRDLGQAMAYRGSAHDEGLSLPLRVWIVAEAASALDHAHRRRGDEGRPLAIVHRDVSPQNILLGYEGEVKVADFGIARADEAGLGRGEDPKILRGKYAYMSPEQARGEPLDRRSDIFSLGIVLYELLTGRRLFRGRTSQETLAMVRAARLPALDAAELGLDPGLARVLARCLAPQRDDRYSHASEIYADLTHWLFQRGEPVGQPTLAAAMERMFPPDDAVSPNKLRVDVLMRAYQDATAIRVEGLAAEASTDGGAHRTAAMPVTRRLKAERRAIALLAVEQRDGEGETFEAACAAAGGISFGPKEGMRLAIFGAQAGSERGATHAVRAALELRRALRLEGPARIEPVPAMVVLDGEGRVVEGIPTEPEPALVERARAMLDGAAPGEIRIPPDLVGELAHRFRIDERSGPAGAGRISFVVGHRARADRDASALRRRAPLVGRRDELRQLSEALVEVSDGGHRVVHVVGEAGSGKSRLLAELRAVLDPRDVLVVTGRADEADAERPFAAIADLVADLCGVEADDTPSERFAKVERLRVLGLAPREVRLCGELLGLAYPVAPVERVGRPRSLELALAVRKAIDALAHERPVLVVLEDLQWLDDATRQILPLVLRGIARPRVMVVLTRRPGALVPQLSSAVDERRTTIRLAPLPRDAAGRLFAAALGARAVEPELLDPILVETGGNPEWIEILAGEARDAESVAIDEGTVRAIAPLRPGVPSIARNRVAARLGQLRATERTLLSVAALLEAPIPVELLFAVEGLVAQRGLASLRRLLSRGLLLPDGAPRDVDVSAALGLEGAGRWGGDERAPLGIERVAFPAAMVARAVREAIEPSERARIHGRIVTALERSAAGLSSAERMRRLGYHAARSNDRRRAPEYLEQAAIASEAAGALQEAAELLVEAARVLREDGEDAGGERGLELTLRAARLALRTGELERARAWLGELATAHGARGRREDRIALALARAEVAIAADVPGDAALALEEVEDLVPAAPAAERAALRLAAGRALLELGRTDEAIARLVESIAAHREVGDAAGRGHALALLALAEARADRAMAADDTAEEALAVAARLGHVDLRYAALAAMGAAQEAAGDRAGAAARLREAVEVALHAGLESEVPQACIRAALAALRTGDALEAAQRAEHASRLARRWRNERIGLLAGAVQAAIAVQEHPDASYVAAIVRAIDRLEAAGRLADAALAVELLALAQRALGDREAADRALARGEALASRAGWRSLARALGASRHV